MKILLAELAERLHPCTHTYTRTHTHTHTHNTHIHTHTLTITTFLELDLSEIGEEVQVAKGKWRPLVVEVGALGSFTGVSKIAASVIAPLADRNVSVYCASTNQDDYVLVSLRLVGSYMCMYMFLYVCMVV